MPKKKTKTKNEVVPHLPARWGTTSLLKHNSSVLEATLPRRQTSFLPDRQSLASILTRLEPYWLFSLGLCGRKSVYRQSKDKWRTKRKNQKINRKDSCQNAARVVDNYNVRLAAVIQQRTAWVEHIISYWLCDSEKAQILL